MTYTTAELRDLKIEELNKELLKGQQEIFRLSLMVRTGAEKNTSLLRKAKKYVARIQSVINSLKTV